MAIRTAVHTAIVFFFHSLRIAENCESIVTIYGRKFKEYKKKINSSNGTGDGMHHVLKGFAPSLFFCLIPLVQPVH